MGNFKDLTDKRFGRLIVIERAGAAKNGHVLWLCKCDCGNTTIVSRSSLICGDTKSCGCLRKENSSQRNKIYNQYDLSGEYGIGYTNKGEEFRFDLDDYDKIKNYCWRVNDKGYIVTSDYNEKGVMSLHRLVMNFPNPKYDIDHINGESSRYDNRKSNLRVCSHSQNMMNAKIRSDNTSGVKGVSWFSKGNKWSAYIFVDKKKIHLGLFTEFEEAVAARKEAEEKYFGEFSYDNSRQGR